MSAAENETDTVPDEAPSSRGSRWWSWALGLMLVASVVFAYQPAWKAGFIWDDDIYVTQNELLTAPDGLKRIWFSTDAPSQYFPLVYTFFRFEHALWGLHAAGYHWVNIILHAANALLLWRLLVVLRIPGAWLGAALFALHPVQVESVAWITERKNLLMGFFFLLALLVWRRFIAREERSDWKFYLLALLCYLLSLASKTTACTLPAALLLMEWWMRGRVRLVRWWHVTPFLLFGVAAGLLAIWWERVKQGTAGEIFSLGILERLLVAGQAFWFYLGKLFWPVDLAFSYPRWEIGAGDWRDYTGLGACLLLALVVWVARRWLGRGPEVGLTFFAATLAPMLGFIMLYTFRYTYVADHYQYLACIGPLALVAGGIGAGLQRMGPWQRFLLPIAAAMLLLPLGFRTWQHARAYENPETLWRATLAVNPASWMAQNNLAIELLRQGRREEAVRHFEEALRLDPGYAEAHYNLGNALFREGRVAEARARYERSLELIPGNPAARYNYAVLLLQVGEVEPALSQLKAALELSPRHEEARQLLGETLLRLGRTEEAIAHFRAALAKDSGWTQGYNRLAAALYQLGQPEEARAQAERLLSASPQNAAAQLEAGLILAGLGRDEEARPYFEKAVALDPQNVEAQFNLGNSFLALRQIEPAMERYRKAVELNPGYAAARLNLANLLLETDRLEEAVAHYEQILALKPDYILAHKNLASALNSLGRFDEAMEHLRTAWKLEADASRR